MDNKNVEYEITQIGLNVPELHRIISEGSSAERAAVVKVYGLFMDELLTDASPAVRIEIAKRGYKPEILMNDTSSAVREAVAQNAPEVILYQMAIDNDPKVRFAVVEGLSKYTDKVSVVYNTECKKYLRNLSMTREALGLLATDVIAFVQIAAQKQLLNMIANETLETTVLALKREGLDDIAELVKNNKELKNEIYASCKSGKIKELPTIMQETEFKKAVNKVKKKDNDISNL